MAKLKEKTFTFAEIQKCYRIPLACTEDHCYLNVGKNSVVKVCDQKPLHTWTLTHPHYFTSPVVHSDEMLYCIMDNDILLKWSVNEDSLKEAEKIKFQESLFAVIPVTGEQPVVLFNSGKYILVDTTNFSNLKPSEFACLEENEELIWADTSASPSDIQVFCLAYNRKNKSHVVYSFSVNKDEKIASNLCSQIIFHETCILKSWCLNNQMSSFLSVWSDGVVYSHKISNSKTSELLSLKDLEANTIVAIYCIDSIHVAVSKGIAKQKECTLEIWDTKFSVLKARQILKTPALENLQIFSNNGSIFLCFNKELVSIPFYVEHSALAAAVGKSMSEMDKTQEVPWNTEGQVVEITSNNEPEVMDTSESKQDSSDSIELIAQRLLNQNSPYPTSIPESELAKLLQLAIRYNKNEGANKMSLKEDAYNILNFVFSASFSDIFLLKYLKKMDLEETLITLELLLSYLNFTIELPSTVTERPSDVQIVNWASLVFQSHMEAFLFSKDKRCTKLLRKLNKVLMNMKKEYEDYAEIQNYFTMIQKNVLPEKCLVGKYCRETLDI